MTNRGRARATSRRTSTPDLSAGFCAYCFDGTPSERRAGKGLSRRMCRKHREHLSRHGHPSKPSWTAAEVRPFVGLAERAIRGTLAGTPGGLGDARAVRATVRAYAGMIERAHTPDAALPRRPQERARAILGRLGAKYLETLRSARQDGPGRALRSLSPDDLAAKLAAVVVGLGLAHDADPAPADRGFLLHQIGKAVHRLAGGYHRTHVYPPEDGRRGAALVMEINRYDHSRGDALAHLGLMLCDRDLISGNHPAALESLVRANIPAGVIANWTDGRAAGSRVTKGGKRRKPYKRPEERGHRRVRLG
jgi:hypothetical protein